ncbi:transcription initiation factor iif subunit alpha [Lentinula edodes]|uniref:Transcription initiation factor iif subunit alpha n=1 Tax=Lentinula edodes TaxID=5353 RepID=A0A1Q3EDT2_LENED|nr:transcription initiation factor iif subunit alpha [Lentinula edodes]
MAPKAKADISLLFHPKKNKKSTSISSPRPPPPNSALNGSRPSSPVKAKPSPKPSPPKPNADDDEADLQLPDGPYQEFRIMSSALNGWKYDVMKFDSRKSVDILRWQGPIKLNRKDLRREDPSMSGAGQAVRPMLGLDGQPVIGSDGKTVMVDSEGRPVTENGASGSGAGKGKGLTNGKKKFQKKTRQVFIVPDEVRNLRKEERYPWVIEDAPGSEVWTAQLDDLGKAETHAFFMPAANDVFKFVPSHRYYKFQKKLKHDMPTDTTSVESAYQKSLKRDPSTWLHQRNGKGPSAATAAMFKAEADGQPQANGSLVHQAQQSLGPGGRRLKAVDSGADDLFGEDDEDNGAAKRRAKEFGGEGDMDEMVYEEDFADDEEKMDVEDTNDQEAKELEERLKKEYKNANKTREGYIDESDEEEEKPGMTKQAKRMQKMLRAREGNDVYESEEEEDNPYASSEEEEDEEEEIVPQTGPAVQPQSKSPTPSQTSSSNLELMKATTQINGAVHTTASRATSPVPGLGGHSVVAKRATSPKVPKIKPNLTNTGRSGSPLASRASSPVSPVGAGGMTTATSPTPGSRAGSPAAVNGVQNGQSQNKKRKAEEAGSLSPTLLSSNGPPKPKKRKAHPTTAVAIPAGPLEERLLIEWLKNTPTANASTRECIQYFTPYLTDEEKKAQFTGLVKEIAQLKNGVLILRPAYRDSPAATPTASG